MNLLLLTVLEVANVSSILQYLSKVLVPFANYEDKTMRSLVLYKVLQVPYFREFIHIFCIVFKIVNNITETKKTIFHKEK